jgi:hypothetical protein
MPPLGNGSERACTFEAAAAECAKRISDAKAGLEELYLTPVDEACRAVLLKQEAAVSHALQIQRIERRTIHMLHQVHREYVRSKAEDSRADGDNRDKAEQKARRREGRIEARARLSNLTTALMGRE